MTLPAAIQQQLDQADAIAAQLHQQELQDIEAASQPIQVELTDEPGTPAHANSPTVTAAPTPAPAAPHGDAEPWEQRYRSLQGKYDADVPRLHSELREMRGQLKTAMELLQARQQAAATPAETKKPLVTQQDVEMFGTDLVDLIGRKAKEIAAEESAALRSHIQNLESKLGQTAQRQELSDDDRFYLRLGQGVPDYREINADQRWLAWLGMKDPLTGATRQDYLNAACANRDVERTAAIFQAFKATMAPADPNAPTPQQELQRQVAPARSRATSTPSAPQAAKVWTSKDITAFYTKVRTGELKGEEAARIEADINAAMVEGRIRP